MSFVEDVRAFLATEMASAVADPTDLTGLAESFERDLLRRAGARGYLDLHGDPKREFDYVVAQLDAPLIDTAMTLAGSAVLRFADDAQRERFLPAMLAGELTMCLAYSERHAGGNLRAITTRAEPDGSVAGGYRLTGHKALVTGAHKAEWCLTLARTGETGAMTMFLVPMDAPGVRVHRRQTMNGWDLDEITFDDVALGPDAVLGSRDGGWSQLLAGMAAERTGMFHLGFARHVLDLLAAHVRGTPWLVDDALVRDAVAALEIDFAAALRLATDAARGERPAVLPSMAKVVATELLQRIAQSATEIAGPAGLVYAPLFTADVPHAAAGGRFAWEYLERVHATIGAGANDLLRDGIAEAGLGLPRAARRGVHSATTAGRAGAGSAPAPIPGHQVTPDRPASDPGTSRAAPDPLRWNRLTADEPGYDPVWWAAALAEGRFAGGFPAEVGGTGTFTDLVQAISFTAAARVPSPVHNGLVQSGFVLVAAGEAGRGPLRDLLAGTRRFAFCLAEEAGGDRPEQLATRAEPAGEEWVLTGTTCWVPYAGSADVLLVLAREGLFAVDAAHARTVPIETLGRDRQRAITLSAAPGTPLLLDGAWAALRPAIARARIALAADAVGAAEAAMLHAAHRVSHREQWGSPLGALQAVKQHCADMLIDLTQAEGAVADAAALVDAGEDAHLAAAAAKVLCVERCRRVSAVAHQLCGGEGIHADQPLHVWYRRIKSSEPVLGSPRFLRGSIASDVLDRPNLV